MTQYRHVPVDDIPPVPSTTQFRHTPVSDELSFEDIHGDMPWWQKIAIGMGRGATDIGHGAQQTFHMLMGNDEKTKEITDRGNKDLEAYAALQEDSPWLSGGGRLLGNAIPFLAAAPATVPGAMGLGALEGAAMFTPEASFKQKGVNTAIGGGLGAVGQGAVNMFRNMPKPSTPEAAQAMRTAVEEGFGLRPQNVSDNPAVNFVSGLSDAEIVGRNLRATQGRDAHNIAKRAANQFADTDSFIASARNRIRADKVEQQELYSVLDDITEFAPDLDPTQIRALTGELIQRQLDTGLPNKTIVGKLKRIAEAQPAEDSFQYWKQLRTQVGDNMVKWNKDGRSTSDLKQVYGAITREMEQTLDNIPFMNDEAKRVFKEANELTSDMINRQSSQVGRLINKQDEAKLNNLLTGGGVTKDSKFTAQQLFHSLDEAGHEAARHRILNFAMDKATDEKGVFSPTMYAKNLQNVKNRASVFFDESAGMTANDIDNMANLMAHITDPKEARGLSQWLIAGGSAGLGAAGARATLGAGTETAGAVGGALMGQVLPGAMTRPRSARAMLEALARYEPGSTEWNMIKQEMVKLSKAFEEGELLRILGMDALLAPLDVSARLAGPLAASAGTQPNAYSGGLNIPIVDGVTDTP